ncbi:hypothetical protein D4764_17G0004980 [Takifugu flavidus]|uniref:Uncharacterized protein n=1 Tax=Takifugu flavidus TaxID=433684 RepID=A0A5C6NVP0_9TELE|nr:hypothetical protein D4764_17G0004980 [Takifugu flavidus]
MAVPVPREWKRHERAKDLDDLRMEGVTGLAPSGCKFSQGRSSYQQEPQAKVTLNICSRCASCGQSGIDFSYFMHSIMATSCCRRTSRVWAVAKHTLQACLKKITEGDLQPCAVAYVRPVVPRLQGDSLSGSRSEEERRPHVPEQAVPDLSSLLPGVDVLPGRPLECEALSQVSSSRQAVWDADLKAVRGGSAVGQTGLLLGDPLFSKELENMGRQLAEVEKDLAKLAEVGKLTSRSTANPDSSLLHSPLRHRALPDTLPLTSLLSRPQSPVGSLSGKTCGVGLPLLSPKSSSLFMGRTKSPSNPGSRTQTPRTPSRPLTPNSLLTRSNFNPGSHKEVTFRRSRSRPVTPTSQPIHPRPLLTPPGLSTMDSLGASLRAYLSEDEFYQQLQAIRQPWHIPSDTDSDILDPPEQDKSEFNTHFFLLDPPSPP